YPHGVVRPPVCHAPRVMRFEVGRTVWSAKRSRFAACLANAVSTSQNICSYSGTPLVVEPAGVTRGPFCRRPNCRQGALAQFRKRGWSGPTEARALRILGPALFLGQQGEDDAPPVLAGRVWSGPVFPADTVESAQVAVSLPPQRLEEVQVATILGVV